MSRQSKKVDSLSQKKSKEIGSSRGTKNTIFMNQHLQVGVTKEKLFPVQSKTMLIISLDGRNEAKSRKDLSKNSRFNDNKSKLFVSQPVLHLS